MAFESGKQLPTPETVPFRLTRDLVDGMGVTGVEGVFRRCCEKTIEVLRNSQDTILPIVEVCCIFLSLTVEKNIVKDQRAPVIVYYTRPCCRKPCSKSNTITCLAWCFLTLSHLRGGQRHPLSAPSCVCIIVDPMWNRIKFPFVRQNICAYIKLSRRRLAIVYFYNRYSVNEDVTKNKRSKVNDKIGIFFIPL